MPKIDFEITDEVAENESRAIKRAFKIKRPKRQRGRTRGHNTQQKDELKWTDKLKDRPVYSFPRPLPKVTASLREILATFQRSNQ